MINIIYINAMINNIIIIIIINAVNSILITIRPVLNIIIYKLWFTERFRRLSDSNTS